ncbi:hypothetical protein MJN76_32655, partial [Salmonella enterica subsp. enterica serovar Anatum]|nr:hypothetical protein [Salmonella enterica subsp. enterica serovar Anatum]
RHLQQLGQQIQSPDLPAWEDNVAEWIEEMKQEWQHDVAVLKASLAKEPTLKVSWKSASVKSWKEGSRSATRSCFQRPSGSRFAC